MAGMATRRDARPAAEAQNPNLQVAIAFPKWY